MDKWLELERQLRHEGTLLPERTRAEILRSAFAAGRLAVEERDNYIVAIAAIWPSPHPAWWEVGTIWVHPNFRRRGLANAVFSDALSKLHCLPGDGAFLITYKPHVADMVLAAGWTEVFWDISKVPEEAIQHRRYRHTAGAANVKERRLFCYPLRAERGHSTEPRPSIGEQQIGVE